MKAIFIAFIAVVVLLLSTCGSNIVLNNWRLNRFAKQLYEYPLPEGAEMKSTDAKVGVLTGNGNHCDFVVTLIIQTAMGLDKVKENYASLKIVPAIQGSEAEQHLNIESMAPEIFSIEIIDAPNTRWFDHRCT